MTGKKTKNTRLWKSGSTTDLDHTTDIGKSLIGCGGQGGKKANMLGEDEKLVEVN
jgi:hypothetical protein